MEECLLVLFANRRLEEIQPIEKTEIIKETKCKKALEED